MGGGISVDRTSRGGGPYIPHIINSQYAALADDDKNNEDEQDNNNKITKL